MITEDEIVKLIWNDYTSYVEISDRLDLNYNPYIAEFYIDTFQFEDYLVIFRKPINDTIKFAKAFSQLTDRIYNVQW